MWSIFLIEDLKILKVLISIDPRFHFLPLQLKTEVKRKHLVFFEGYLGGK